MTNFAEVKVITEDKEKIYSFRSNFQALEFINEIEEDFEGEVFYKKQFENDFKRCFDL